MPLMQLFFLKSGFVYYLKITYLCIQMSNRLLSTILTIMSVLFMAIPQAFAATASAPPSTSSGGPFRYIYVRLTDGTQISAGATSILQITDGILVAGSGETAIEYPLEKVQGWTLTFKDDITTSEAAVNADGITFTLDNDIITVSGLTSTDAVALWSVEGRQYPLLQQKPPVITISTASLPEGIYILRAGTRSMKFVRK